MSEYKAGHYRDLESIREEGKSTLVSRNITVLGRRTSVRLEPQMWLALKDIARREKCRIHDVCTLISVRKNPNTSLTAAVRVFLMLYYRAASTEEGHGRAGHGNFETMLQRARIDVSALRIASRRALTSGGFRMGEERPDYILMQGKVETPRVSA